MYICVSCLSELKAGEVVILEKDSTIREMSVRPIGGMLRSCKQHPSAGCCLPFTAYRTSIGGKRTRYSRNNSNVRNTAQTSFALFPMLERLFAVIALRSCYHSV